MRGREEMTRKPQQANRNQQCVMNRLQMHWKQQHTQSGSSPLMADAWAGAAKGDFNGLIIRILNGGNLRAE